MKNKGSKGITLIALIITIIVLVILAGVAIVTLTGNNNIIENANKAVGKYNEKANEEQGILSELEEKLKEYTGGGSSTPTTPSDPVTPPKDDPPTIPVVDVNGLATKKETIIPDKTNPNLQISIPTGFAPAILQTGTTQSLPGQDGSVKGIMANNEWNNITAEDINKGIVVVDGDGNEFVWIPITDISEFDRKAYGATIAETSTSRAYWEDTSTSEYTNMVSSVTTNKGFYVARYEASKNNNSTKAQSKREANVWKRISQTDAIKKSANYNNALHSHLMYGIEWDSILNWLNENATISSSASGKTKTMELSDIQTNSSSWGNYTDSTGDASTNSYDLQTSGTSEYWKANNIYDLAGNVIEWTQEKYSTWAYRAYRGGSYDRYGVYGSAAHRSCVDESYTISSIGFRVSFYL